MTPILTKSHPAASAVRGHRIVELVVGGAAETTSATGKAVGIADAAGAPQGAMLDVHLVGIAEVRAGAAFGAGVQLTSDNQGRAIAVPAPSGAAARVRVVAVAMEAALAADDIVRVLVIPAETFVPAA